MLDQTFPKVNFVGKDGLQWFIGQVTTDESWRDFSIKYGYRAKVRILGAHPPGIEVKDEELPWAHFLTPSVFGSGKQFGGTSFALRGGETVVGFWLDGEDGQIPIIWGSLFSGQNEENVVAWEQVLKQGGSFFKPIAHPQSLRLSAANSRIDGQSTEHNGVTQPHRNETPDGQTSRQKIHDDKPIVVSVAKECKAGKGFMSDVGRVLQSFIEITNGLKEYKEGYIDPVLGVISDIPRLISQASKIISGAFASLFRLARKFMFEEIYKIVENIIDFLVPESFLKDIAVKKAIDTIFCVIENIIKGIKDFIEQFLTEIIGKFANLPLCAAEGFVGGLINDVTNQILKAIGPAMGAINEIVGGVGTFMSYVDKAVGYAQAGLKFLSCEDDICPPEPYDWATNFGPVKKDVVNFQSALDISGKLGNLEGDVNQTIGSWFGESEDDIESGGEAAQALAGGCNPYVLECGPPTIEIFGGGGVGAAANAIVNSVGNVVGVDMTDFGVGYSSNPFVSIIDSCGNGQGATGTPVVEDGKVVNIIIDEPGNGYLPAPGTELPEGDGASDTDGNDTIGEVDDIAVISPGNGYTDEDTITGTGPDGEPIVITPVLTEDGEIVGGVVKSSGFGIDSIPDLTINTSTGNGAFIRPVLKFTRVSKVKERTIPANAKLIRVVDCVSR